MKREEIEELKGLAASMGLYDDKNPCKRAVVLGKAIKALEQEPTTKNDLGVDCVARQDIERYIEGFINEYTPKEELEFINLELDGLKHLPSVTPQETRWIHVSERLPEDIKPVIVTWKNTDPKSYYQYIVGKHFIGTAHYKSSKWYWYSSVTEDLLAEYGKCDSEEFDEAIEVVAWMPLPQPYKGVEE